jgi:hypothetical protein
MSDKLVFQQDSLERVITGYQQSVADFDNMSWAISKDNVECFGFGAYSLHLQSGVEILARYDQINARLAQHSISAHHLYEQGNDICSTFAQAEQQLASLLLAVPFMKDLFNWFTGGKLDEEDKMKEILNQMNEEMEGAVHEFEDVIALILASAALTLSTMQNELGGVSTTWDSDLEEYKKMHQVPKGFSEMNVWELVKQNPDIKRKGVMAGFSGEYWDPETKMQCTLYAAMRRTEMGKPLPDNGPWGNGGSWAASALRSGVTVNSTPTPGDVFCQTGGYGHVGIVERVNPDGSIFISEANYGYEGAFHTRTLTPAQYAGWQFIK